VKKYVNFQQFKVRILVISGRKDGVKKAFYNATRAQPDAKKRFVLHGGHSLVRAFSLHRIHF
jgi:hypothetical protein